ncbi:hypothetical protein [Micromonospora sp. CPCC 205561]|uniref:hypothetical protein n=1 Tax=Micromonospora sp. CPCC 205561 TaxID=3122407 RepID=UPI002FF1459E
MSDRAVGGFQPVTPPAGPGRPGPTAAGGVDALWVGGLVLAAVGGALALAGLTLPWAAVTPASRGGSGYVTQLSDLHPFAAPMAALVLIVVGVGVALSFASVGRLSSYLWFPYSLVAATGAVAALFLTVHLVKGATLLVREPVTHLPERVTVGDVLPSTGCLLYAVGLSLVACGLGGSSRSRRELELLDVPAGVGTLLRRARGIAFPASVVLAVVGAVTSAVSPWYRSVPGLDGSTELDPLGPDRGDVQLWITAYRAGLVACLVLTVLALLAPGAARWLRRTGQTVAAAVTVGLMLGYLLLWRPLHLTAQAGHEYGVLAPGVGHGLGILTMVAVALSLALMPTHPFRAERPVAAGPAPAASAVPGAGMPNDALVAALLAAAAALSATADPPTVAAEQPAEPDLPAAEPPTLERGPR